MTHHEIILKLTALESLALPKTSGSETGNETLDYIPGSALLGATAYRALDQGWKSDAQEFRRCFLTGEVSFGDGNPGTQAAQPVPRCYVRPKGDAEYNDRIIDAAVATRKNPKDGARAWLASKPESGASTQTTKLEESRDGYVESGKLLKLDRILKTHTAIDGDNRSAAENKLFSYECLPAGTVFNASIRSSDTGLLSRLQQILAGSELHIGRSRATGYGRVKVESIQIRPLTLAAGKYEQSTVLTLTTDLLLPPACNSIVALLKDLHNIRVSDSCMQASWSLTRSVQSFHGQWGLPREIARAIVRGSTFLLEMDEASFAQLQGLMPQGLGLRTHEGYGRFLLNDPELHPDEPLHELKE